jgi:naphthoate synthase
VRGSGSEPTPHVVQRAGSPGITESAIIGVSKGSALRQSDDRVILMPAFRMSPVGGILFQSRIDGRRRVPAYAGAVSVSELFDPAQWMPAPGPDGGAAAYTDITAHVSRDGRIARIAFDRPEVRNAFRPHTVDELYTALDIARQDPRIGVVLLTGNGPSPKDGGWAFCSGGDQRIRGRDGYKYSDDEAAVHDPARAGRLHILEVQRLIRFMPKVVIAVVPGWAAGGGHSLHVVCDLTVASREHGRFKQTDADVGSFDAGYGSAYFARQIGQKFAREVFFLAEEYSAQRAYEMGAVNRVVPHADLEREAIAMARTILTKSPTAIRMLKFAFNAVDDGMVGQQVFAGEATRLAYGTDEAVEGRDAFLAKRDPDWSPYPWQF